MAPQKQNWKPGQEAFKRILQFESSKIWYECTECGTQYRAAGSCACPVCGMCYPAKALGAYYSESEKRTRTRKESERWVR